MSFLPAAALLRRFAFAHISYIISLPCRIFNLTFALTLRCFGGTIHITTKNDKGGYMDIFILVLELIGAAAFAVSGAMTGIRKNMDIFGAFVLALTVAVGGGIIRDIILGAFPPAIFQNPIYSLTGISHMSHRVHSTGSRPSRAQQPCYAACRLDRSWYFHRFRCHACI